MKRELENGIVEIAILYRYRETRQSSSLEGKGSRTKYIRAKRIRA